MSPNSLTLDELHQAYVARVNTAISVGDETLVDQFAADYDADVVALLGPEHPDTRPEARADARGTVPADHSRWRRFTHRSGRHAA